MGKLASLLCAVSLLLLRLSKCHVSLGQNSSLIHLGVLRAWHGVWWPEVAKQISQLTSSQFKATPYHLPVLSTQSVNLSSLLFSPAPQQFLFLFGFVLKEKP